MTGAGPTATTERMKRGMGQLTWRSAAREVGRAALRHKALSAIIAVCVAGSLIAIGVIGSASSQPARPAVVAAPAFSLPVLGDESGQQITLSKYRGQPVIVNFFASWCVPCKVETPQFDLLYRRIAPKGVAFLGIDTKDDREHAQTFVDGYKISYPIIFDEAGETALHLGNIPANLPFTVLLDKQGKVAAVYFGGLTVKDLDGPINQLLAET